MSFGGKLDKLDLQYCTGIEHLGRQFKTYINLTELSILECGEIDWQWFECTRKVNHLYLKLNEAAKKFIDLAKLVDNMPGICVLQIDGYFLKSLEPGAAIMKRLMPKMEALKQLNLDNVGFYDLVQIQNVIGLIRISPNLQKLIIELEPKVKSGNGMNLSESGELVVSPVVQYLQSPDLIDLIFNQPETVEIEVLVDSTELQFIKLLLTSSPSLRRMEISHYVIKDPEEALRILAELVRFPRASTTAEITWM
ncbi:hypothetical protein POM88_029165 [Heracleum sosnowskyi]|uniref:Uncharacterized protein n=1 Tax=Heracleum sosnowskyi TaxID=360622 RepID=A0AAD8HUX9_9APIA|nr:hypothetical protein POM88_029165 [Heracleum sosnowskyi]